MEKKILAVILFLALGAVLAYAFLFSSQGAGEAGPEPTPTQAEQALAATPTEQAPTPTSTPEQEVIVMYHNGRGPMCIAALDYFNEKNYSVEQHLTDDPGFYEELAGVKQEYASSEGVSDKFGYYPMIFVGGRAFSGFNEEIGQSITEILESG